MYSAPVCYENNYYYPETCQSTNIEYTEREIEFLPVVHRTFETSLSVCIKIVNQKPMLFYCDAEAN